MYVDCKGIAHRETVIVNIKQAVFGCETMTLAICEHLILCIIVAQFIVRIKNTTMFLLYLFIYLLSFICVKRSTKL